MTLGTVTIGQARKDGRTIFSLSAMGSASLESAPSRPPAHDCQNACGQHRGFLGHKGVQGRSGSMPTLVSTSRTKMGDNQRGC